MAEKRRLVIAADLTNLGDVRDFIEEASRSLGAQESAVMDLYIAVDEAVTNIILHGYAQKSGEIEIELNPEGNTLVVYLRDKAVAFNPSTHAVPEPVAQLESGKIGGFGLYLIRHLVDEVRHRVTNSGGNELTLVKRGVIRTA